MRKFAKNRRNFEKNYIPTLVSYKPHRLSGENGIILKKFKTTENEIELFKIQCIKNTLRIKLF